MESQSVTVRLVMKVLRFKMVCPSKTRLIRLIDIKRRMGYAWALAMLDQARAQCWGSYFMKVIYYILLVTFTKK